MANWIVFAIELLWHGFISCLLVECPSFFFLTFFFSVSFSLIISSFVCSFVHVFYTPINWNRVFHDLRQPTINAKPFNCFFFFIVTMPLFLLCFISCIFFELSVFLCRKKTGKTQNERWRSTGNYLEILFVTETGNHPRLTFWEFKKKNRPSLIRFTMAEKYKKWNDKKKSCAFQSTSNNNQVNEWKKNVSHFDYESYCAKEFTFLK